VQIFIFIFLSWIIIEDGCFLTPKKEENPTISKCVWTPLRVSFLYPTTKAVSMRIEEYEITWLVSNNTLHKTFTTIRDSKWLPTLIRQNNIVTYEAVEVQDFKKNYLSF
jgi:hypothetical protein